MKLQIEKAALKNITETVRIARCPKCNERSKSMVQHFWTRQAFKLIGSFIFMVILGAIVYQITGDDIIYTIFGAGALLVVIIVYFVDVKWRWKTADRRVVFLDELR